ncbi:MAG: hypothetical protein J6K55_03585 [Clostridia bacterium]|nr:hypothetical protein [Clostridia bacterium]
MRLRERDKRDMTVVACTGFDDDVYQWGQGWQIRAAEYPNTRMLDAKIYGDRVREMKLLLYDKKDVLLEVGMGVSMDGDTPAYRIISVARWDHQSAVLEKIPEGRRGVWDND